MVTYYTFMKISDFQKHSANIRNSLIHYCISWSNLKNTCIIQRIFMEQSRNIPIFNILRTLFGNIPRKFIGNFFQIFWEYIMGIFHEYSTKQYSRNIIWEYSLEFHRKLFPNILGIYHGNVPQVFYKYIFVGCILC